MKLEYLKGSDNKIAYTLSRLPPEKLDEDAIVELLDYARTSHKPRAKMANMNVIEEGEHVDQEVIVRYNQIVKQHKNFCNLANLDWVEAQKKDPVIPTIIDWVKQPKGDRRTLVEYLTGVTSYEKCYMPPDRRSSPFRTTYCTSRLPQLTAQTPCQSSWSWRRAGRLPLMDDTVAQDTRVMTVR